MKQIITLFIASVLLIVFSAESAASADACDQFIRAGNDAEAVKSAQDALAGNPEQVDALLCLARAQNNQGKHADAIATLKKAEKHAITPADRLALLVMLGNTYKAESSFDDAIAAYRRVLEFAGQEKISRFQMIAHNLTGESLEAKGNTEEALEQYQRGLEKAANDNERADCYSRIAHIYSKLGQHDKAIEFQIKSVLLEERSGDLNHYANANIELARICLAGESYRDAERWLDKFIPVIAINDSPYWEARAHHLLGKVKAAQGEATAAGKAYSRAGELAMKANDNALLDEIRKDASIL